MKRTTREDFYLNRRGGIRVEFRSAIRFQSDPRRKFQLAHAVTQNISLRGMQILSPTVPDPKRRFEVWIPIEGSTIVPAIAHTEWVELEDSLGDSPYWVRSGISLSFRNDTDRRLFVDTVLKRANVDRIRREQEASKIGFVF